MSAKIEKYAPGAKSGQKFNNIRAFFTLPGITLVFLGGILIRLVLMLLSIHSDLVQLAWSSRPVANGTWNFYEVGLKNWLSVGWNGPEPIMSHGPLFFLIYGGWLRICDFLHIFNLDSWSGIPTTFTLTAVQIFIFRVPLLLFDLTGCFFISRFFPGQKRVLAAGYWLFSPLVLYFAYTGGQDDILMLSMVCLSLYFAAKTFEKSSAKLPIEAYLSMIALGLAVCFKLFPLFYVPLAAVILARRAPGSITGFYLPAIRLCIAALAPVAILFIPLGIVDKTFLKSVLYSTETNNMGLLGFDTGSGFFAFYWVAYFGVLAWVIFSKASFDIFKLNFFLGLVTVIYLVLAVYPPQFFSWLMPFMLIFLIQKPSLFPGYLLMLACFSIYILDYEGNLDLNGLLPVWNAEIKEFGTGKQVLSSLLQWRQVQSISTAILIITLFIILLKIALELEIFWSAKPGNLPFWLEQQHSQSTAQKVSVPPEKTGIYRLFLPLLLFYGILLCSFLAGALVYGSNKVSQNSKGKVEGYLSRDTRLVQKFNAPPGKLEQIGLFFGTNRHYNTSHIHLVLQKDTPVPSPVFTTGIEAVYLDNLAYYYVKLPVPLELSKQTQLSLVLTSPDGTTQNSVSIYSDNYTGNPLLLPLKYNGSKTAHVLTLNVVYAIDWGSLVQSIIKYFGKTPFFSIIYWSFCLILLVYLCTSLVMRPFFKDFNQKPIIEIPPNHT